MLCDFDELLNDVINHFSENGVPFSVQIELTKKCCLDCKHCYVDHEAGEIELSTSEVFDILDDLSELGVMQLAFTGGEIFVRPDIWEILEKAKSLGFFVKLLTSAVLIGEKEAERIKDLNIGEVSVSLYSNKAEIHDEITKRKGSFDKVVNAVKLLLNQDISVWVKTLVMLQNHEDIEEIAEFAKTLGAYFQIDTIVTPAENNVRNPLEFALNEKQTIDFYSHIEKAKFLFSESALQEPEKITKSAHTTGQICRIGQTNAVIDSTGMVKPCSIYPAIGNVREIPFSTIWRESEEIKCLKSMTYETQKSCVGCDLIEYCSPCPAYAKIETGDDRACSQTSRIQANAIKVLEKALIKAKQIT